MAKTILKRSQAEIRSMLLETEGKVILVTKQQRAWLDCVRSCPKVLWKAELGSNEIGYLIEAISKQSIEEIAWLLLNAYSKIQEERT